MHPLDIVSTVHNLQFSVSAGALGNKRSTSGSVLEMSTVLSKKRKRTDNTKRGRPRADVISALILEGSVSQGRIRCRICSRIFPREKSLQAHLRTHTGERPYKCDFPGCNKAFCQSGQLKTHQRLHTGEKPFACSVAGCTSRFTHANRHCNQHPYAGLKRVETQVLTSPDRVWDFTDDNAVATWLRRQAERKQSTSTAKEKPHKLKRKQSAEDTAESSDDDSISSSQRSQPDSHAEQEDRQVLVSAPDYQPSHIEYKMPHLQFESERGYQALPLDCKMPQPLDCHQAQHDKWVSALALIELATGCGSL